MAAATRRRPYVDPAQLDPCVRVLVGRLRRQADHELRGLVLLPQQAVEDERVDEAAWTPA